MSKPYLRLAILALVACLPSGLAAQAAANEGDALFPEPPELRSAVTFWQRVYLEVTTDGGFIHDGRELGIVYETLSFGGQKSARHRAKKVKARKRHWQGVLQRLARGGAPKTEAERALVERFSAELRRKPLPRDYDAARSRLRFQLGQRNKFREGLVRSGAYEDAMRAVFRGRGLPEDLAFLPHVESSFNVHAYSKYGAAGVWQFMRSTGRRFLEINYVIDERLDPMRATIAAAELLGRNYQVLGSWPLAITAYNHGTTGMSRAKRKVGTSDMGAIVRRYRSRTFGFASRNFYAQFLAARKILLSYQEHFGPIERDEPEALDEVVLPFYASVKDLEQYLGISADTVRRYNRDLRKPVFTSGKRIPKGYTLRLPAGTAPSDVLAWLAKIPAGRQHAKQHRSNYYQVRRGDTLSRIAKRHGTRVATLVALNNLPSRHRIYPGQVIQLPDPNAGRGGSRPKAKPTVVAKASPAKAELRAPEPDEAPAPQPEPETEKSSVATPALSSLPEPLPAVSPEADAPAEPEPEPAVAEPLVGPALVSESDAVDPDEAGFAAPDEVAESDIVLADAPEPTSRNGSTVPVPPSLGEDSPWRRIDGDRVRVDALETLGHYAEWLEIPTQRLRVLNGLRSGRPIRMGQRLRLDFSRVGPETFLLRRMEYHKGIEEDFFGSYRVTGTLDHALARGQSLWQLAHQRYGVPTWLIQRYNPELDLSRLAPGTNLRIPTVEPLVDS